MKFDSIPAVRRTVILGTLFAATALSGCMSSPTYGTGKSANTQLVEDLTGILSIGPDKNKQAEIDYNPRPELVKPGSMEVLPEPQQAVASIDNPAWPESPEERRARIRAQNGDGNSRYAEGVIPDAPSTQVTSALEADGNRGRTATMARGASRQEVQARIRENYQGSPTQRRYLSEPPVAYRQPAASAPVGDVGEAEWKKDKQNYKPRSWREIVPTL